MKPNRSDQSEAIVYPPWKAELERQGVIKVSSSGYFPTIYGDDKTIYSHSASTCIMVLLYSPDSGFGTILHIPVTDAEECVYLSPKFAKNDVPSAIKQLRDVGSKKILAMLVAGQRNPTHGSKKEKRESNTAKIWKLILSLLEDYPTLVQRVKNKKLKDVGIFYITLSLKNGEGEYYAYNKAKRECFTGVFRLK